MQFYYTLFFNTLINFTFFSLNKQNPHRKKRSTGWNQYKNDASVDKIICKARYQQSPIEVFARFLAIDQVSVKIFNVLRFTQIL